MDTVPPLGKGVKSDEHGLVAVVAYIYKGVAHIRVSLSPGGWVNLMRPSLT